MVVLSAVFVFVAKHVAVSRKIEILLQFIFSFWSSSFLSLFSTAVCTRKVNVDDSLLVVMYGMGRFWCVNRRISTKG